MASVPAYDHIVVVVEENHNFDEIIGSPAAPYINGLAAGGALLSNYTAITHPSEPNYFALYAGSTFGVTDDNAHSEPDPTLATILQGAGKTFTGYIEPASPAKHNPWESFPEGFTVERDFSSFPTSNNFASLPSVSFVVPDQNDDMHDGSIQQGDTWLQTNIDSYAQWAKTHNSLLIVVWDEGDVSSNDQVASIFYGAHVVPGSYDSAYNHYNLLSTILAAFNLTGPNNAATASAIQVFQSSTSSPILTVVTETPSSGDLNAGNTVTIALGTSEAVTVSGSPMLTLNDGGTATYDAGTSTSTSLVFDYTVASTDTNVASLAVTSLDVPAGASIVDDAGNNLDPSLSGLTQTGPQISTSSPILTAVTETPSSGDLNAGNTVTIALGTSEAVTVSGSPTLTLNDGGTATYDAGTSTSTSLVFNYTVASTDTNVASLAVTSLDVPAGASIVDDAGSNLDPSLSGLTQTGPQISTSSLILQAVTETPSSGDLNAGNTVTIALGTIEAVTVSGSPTLTLNDGGTATYDAGTSTSTSLVFNYTVASTDTNVASLAVTC